jgi:hypothetical protein
MHSKNNYGLPIVIWHLVFLIDNLQCFRPY